MTWLVVFSALLAPDALGQRTMSRLKFVVTPPSPTALGQPITLDVRPVMPGTTYRYVAKLTVTGAGRPAVGMACAAVQSLGTGSRVTWTPPSGSYRLTVHSLTGLATRDSASVSYQLNAPSGGWLSMSITQIPNPSPPGSLTFQLSTNDRGAGNAYQWVVRFQAVPGPVPMLDWRGDSPGPTTSVPLTLTPGTYNVSARVGVHLSNPCQIIETSSGTLAGQVVR